MGMPLTMPQVEAELREALSRGIQEQERIISDFQVTDKPTNEGVRSIDCVIIVID
jgi:hypothetical protein